MTTSVFTPLTLSTHADIRVPVLERHSPRITQSSLTKHGGVLLKPHQQAVVYRCKQLENCPLIVVKDASSVKTNVGVIADCVGSGKSYCILELIAQGPHALETQCSSKTNLILIPNYLDEQWKTYISRYAPHSMKVAYVTTQKEYETFQGTPRHWELFDIVLMTFTYYLVHAMSSETRIQRVFIDEADLLPKRVRGFCPINCAFTWFVSSNISFMLNPVPFRYHFERGVHAGIPVHNFTREVMTSLGAQDHMRRGLFVSCNLSFALESLDMSPLIHQIIPCTMQPMSLVIDSLKKQKYTDAMAYLGVDMRNHILPPEDIIHHIEKRAPTNHHIRDRIGKDALCNICYEENMHHKTILTCCHNTFCFRCICPWLHSKMACPLCKKNVSVKDDVYITKDTRPIKNVQDSYGVLMEESSKLANAKSILTNSIDMSTARVIIMTSIFDRDTTQQLLAFMYQQNIPFRELKGNARVIRKCIRDYKNGSVRVLLLDLNRYGHGINLENTTDIIILPFVQEAYQEQVIGRAFRLGRAQIPLRVWHLLYPNEMSFDV